MYIHNQMNNIYIIWFWILYPVRTINIVELNNEWKQVHLMAIYRSTHVGLYRNYNANNNFESIAVVNVAKDGYSPKVQAQS